MELLIAILMCLHLYATPDDLQNDGFNQQNQTTIDCAHKVIDNHWYLEVDGGVIIDPNVTI